MANSWGESGTTWGQGDWGQQNVTTVSLTGLSITSSLGVPDVYPEEGWGRFNWGQMGWGDDSNTVYPTGLSITASVGEASGFSEQGWGRSTWGNEPWGDSNSPTVILTDSFLATASLGTLPYAQSEEGWGRDEWGIGNWGENTTTVIVDGFEIAASQGPSGWGQAPWNEMIGWGGALRCETTQLSIADLTGIEATLSLGTLTLNYDFKVILTTSLQMSAGLGVLNINDGADHSQGVGSLLTTMSLGTPGHEMAYDLTGIEATMSLGTATATNTEIINLTGIEANFYALNVPSVDDMAIGLSGLSITGSVGSLTVTDMQVGISGLEMTGDLGSGGVSPLHYKDVDITGNTSYTYVKHAGE